MADEAELTYAFAQAVVRPGGNAGLIDESNRIKGWVPIEEAVTSGQAFMVEPREGILPLDLDTPDDHAWASGVREQLARRGCEFVITESGTPGRGHLWIIAPPGWSNHYTKAQVYALGGEHDQQVARLDTATRPPMSPHRSGRGRSTVVEPGLATALALFRSVHPRKVPDSARNQLRWLDPSKAKKNRGTPSRGITLHAVACAAVNARWTYDMFVAELKRPENLTASKYRDLPPGAREDYAAKLWSDAVQFVRQAPPRASSLVARQTVESLEAGFSGLRWSSRTGANDRAIYSALLKCAREGGTLEVSASVRQLGRLANLSNNGVSAALRRLRAMSLVERLDAPKHGFACRYRLLPVGEAASKVFAAGDNNGLLMGAQRSMLSHRTALLADIFSNHPGLGLSCRETWEALPEQPTKTAQVVAARPGALRPATVRAHLRKLLDHGLAERAGHRWWRLNPKDPDLERLADALGVRGRAAARTAYNDSQVAAYRERFNISLPASPAASRPSGLRHSA